MKYLLLTCIVIIGTGCASKERYYWGHYEDLIYDTYNRPDKALPAMQIEKILADIKKADAKGKQLAPGIYAHLGMMYAAQSNAALAEAAFKKEKELYPESATLIDGMIRRVNLKEKPNERI